MGFRVGRIVSPSYFWGDRINKDIARGPYRNYNEWFLARLADQEHIINDTEDEEEVKEAETIKELANRLSSLIPLTFLHEAPFPVRTALWHHDLSMQKYPRR